MKSFGSRSTFLVLLHFLGFLFSASAALIFWLCSSSSWWWLFSTSLELIVDAIIVVAFVVGHQILFGWCWGFIICLIFFFFCSIFPSCWWSSIILSCVLSIILIRCCSCILVW